jgi:hypothetical protein
LNNIIILELLISLLLFFLIKKTYLTEILKKEKLFIAPQFRLNKIQIFCISLVLGFALVKISINLVNPPFGWDSLNYHFTFPVEWLKNHNLNNPIVVSDYVAPTYYPINGSLIFFWLILPFKSVFLADIGQLPFFVMAFLSVFAIARKSGVCKIFALFAGVLFTMTPNYFKQLEISYIDVIVAALFLTALNFLLIYYHNLAMKSLIISGISIGLLIGTKITALPQAAILLLLFFYIIFKKINKIGLKRAVLSLGLLIFIIVLFGGFTYIKNYIFTRNPFYPLDLKIFNFTIFKGVMSKGYPGGEIDFSWSTALFHEGLGIGFTLLVLPGLIITIIRSFRKKIVNKQISFLIFIIPMLYLVYRFIIALPNLRYLYSLFGICYVCAFWTMQELKIPIRIMTFLVVVCLLAAVFELAGHLELFLSAITSVILYFSMPYLLKAISSIMYNPVKALSFAILFFILLQVLNVNYINNEFRRYQTSQKYSGFWPDAIEAWIWLNKNTQGNNIAYVGRPVPFPLYGTNFKNNVYYVSVNNIDPAKLHYFPNSYYEWGKDYSSLHRNLEARHNYRSGANYSTWLNNVMKRKTDYLFIYSLHQIKGIEFPMEDAWAINHPNKFNLVFSNKTIHIYKIF